MDFRRAVFDPFFSPDSSWLGFASFEGTGRFVLSRVAVAGGPPTSITELDSGTRGAVWTEDDTIIFGTGRPSGLWRVSVDGGEPVEFTKPDAPGVNHAWPEILPGGRGLLFTVLAGSASPATPLDFVRSEIAVLDLDSGEQRVLLPVGTAPQYVPSGHIVYSVEGALRAVGFDLDRLEVYRDALANLNSGRIELLDHARLLAQLGALERRTARGGRDSIDHPPGGYDDLANVVCGVAVAVLMAPQGYGVGHALTDDRARIVLTVDDAERELARRRALRATVGVHDEVMPLRWVAQGPIEDEPAGVVSDRDPWETEPYD